MDNMIGSDFDFKAREDFSNCLHGYLRLLPYNIDLKISIFVAGIIGCLLFTVKLFYPTNEVPVALWKSVPIQVAVLDYLALAFFVVAIFCSMLALWARTSGEQKGIFSFVSLASKPSSEFYVTEIFSAQTDTLIRARLAHCYELAKIVENKILWFHRSMVFGFLGIAAAVAGSLF